MNCSALPGLALLAKLHAFFARSLNGPPQACSRTGGVLTSAFARRNARAEIGGGLAEDAFECAVELRERLEPHIVSNFADAQVWIQKPGPRIFQPDAGDVIGER